MKLKAILFSLLYFISSHLSAQWLNVGKAHYNWGPFHVYTISLFTETGKYEEHLRPLMLSFNYAKPIEGKSFGISLIKDLDDLAIEDFSIKNYHDTLKSIFPDISPNDTLSYIALEDRGYFILNDKVLEPEFDNIFSQAFISIWLSPNTSYSELQPKLLGLEKEKEAPSKSEEPKLEDTPIGKPPEETKDPQPPSDDLLKGETQSS